MILLPKEARELFLVLKENDSCSVSDLEEQGWDQATVMRSALWLQEEKLLTLQEKTKSSAVLSRRGEEVLTQGFPERVLLETVQRRKNLKDISLPHLNIAVGKAIEQGLIRIEKKEKDRFVVVTEQGLSVLEEEDPRTQLKKLQEGDLSEKQVKEFIRRGLAERREERTRILSLTKKGASLSTKDIQVGFRIDIPSEDVLLGRRHFAREMYDYIRRVWLEMGFKEMRGSLVVPSLLNFDALYTAQDHPVRELHDTFFVEPEKADLSSFSQITQRIARTHEDGWNTGSDGWQYAWKKEEAEKNVLRTHTTSISAATLSSLTKEDLPAKFFAIGRNFRNETVDWKHLAEFYQVEGIVVDENANFRHLLGYLKRFFQKLGFEKARFRPAYYPYTELSVEIDVFDTATQRWMGMGGAGLFRPEVVKPLLGFEVPVLAWGPGADRLITKNYGITDIRKLYANELGFLRSCKRTLR